LLRKFVAHDNRISRCGNSYEKRSVVRGGGLPVYPHHSMKSNPDGSGIRGLAPSRVALAGAQLCISADYSLITYLFSFNRFA
jgi:hypothetical protein